MDSVAKHAGVSRAALYRRYASPAELALDALESAGIEAVRMTISPNLHDDVERYLRSVTAALSRRTVTGEVFRGLLSVALVDHKFDVDFAKFIARRREPLARRLRAARPDISDAHLASVLDLLFGPLLYKLMIRGEGVAHEDIRWLVVHCLWQTAISDRT